MTRRSPTPALAADGERPLWAECSPPTSQISGHSIPLICFHVRLPRWSASILSTYVPTAWSPRVVHRRRVDARRKDQKEGGCRKAGRELSLSSFSLAALVIKRLVLETRLHAKGRTAECHLARPPQVVWRLQDSAPPCRLGQLRRLIRKKKFFWEIQAEDPSAYF